MLSNCKSLFKFCSCAVLDDNNEHSTIIHNEYIGSLNENKETQTTKNDFMFTQTNSDNVIHKANTFYILNDNKPKLTRDKIKKIIITKTAHCKSKP